MKNDYSHVYEHVCADGDAHVGGFEAEMKMVMNGTCLHRKHDDENLKESKGGRLLGDDDYEVN